MLLGSSCMQNIFLFLQPVKFHSFSTFQQFILHCIEMHHILAMTNWNCFGDFFYHLLLSFIHKKWTSLTFQMHKVYMWQFCSNHFCERHFFSRHFYARHFCARHFCARHFCARHFCTRHFCTRHIYAWHLYARHLNVGNLYARYLRKNLLQGWLRS